jgi:hypothetical protein
LPTCGMVAMVGKGGRVDGWHWGDCLNVADESLKDSRYFHHTPLLEINLTGRHLHPFSS